MIILAKSFTKKSAGRRILLVGQNKTSDHSKDALEV